MKECKMRAQRHSLRHRSLVLCSLLAAAVIVAVLYAPTLADEPPEVIAPSTHPAAKSVGPAGSLPNPMAPSVVLVGLRADSGSELAARSPDTPFGRALPQSVLERADALDAEPVFSEIPGTPAARSLQTGIDLGLVYRLHLRPGADIMHAIERLQASPAVAYAEPDYLAHLAVTPNDPFYSEQWGLSKINAPSAWDLVTGTSDVVVAVVDSGVDTAHPDLSAQLWANPGEIPANGIDDDSNGYVDDIHGWNLADSNADLSDSTGHGTTVAGIIAAETNNEAGVAGTCWGCKLMIVKVVQPGGYANYSDIAAGVVYAAQKGAKVINLSLGGYTDSSTLRAAIDIASQSAAVVCGAGNDNLSDPFYPAAYGNNVLAVAGTSITDTKANTSNYGSWIDVVAPGEAITTTFDGGGYGSSSGTSLAAPFVSGLSGLLASQHPDWTANQVLAQVVQTAHNIDDLNPGYEGQLGSGRIDAYAAAATVPQPLLETADYTANGQLNGAPQPGETVDLFVRVVNHWGRATNVQGTLTTEDSHATVTVGSASYGTVDSLATVESDTAYAFDLSASVPNNYPIALLLSLTADGAYSVSLPFTVTTASETVLVGGFISSDTTWSNDHVYLVESNIIVNPGVTLTIEPGTLVKVGPGRTIRVDGSLRAVGTANEPILFTSTSVSPARGDWDTIEIWGDADFEHATIEYGGFGLAALAGSALSVSHCTIQNNGFVQSNPRCGDWGSGICLEHSNAIVEYSRICDNDGVESNSSNGITILGGSTTIRNNVICGNNPTPVSDEDADDHGAGVKTQVSSAGTLTVSHNALIGNAYGIIFRGVGAGHDPQVENNAILGSMRYDAMSLYDGPITATQNYWGSTDSSVIASHIYDIFDDIRRGPLYYEPFLSEPAPGTPSFLLDLTITPAEVIGIQQATFLLEFSAPMDQSLNPVVSFGASAPYTSHLVTDDFQWLGERTWSATYEVTSLVPRGAYTMSVAGAMGTDGMEMPRDSRFSFVVDYAGEIGDLSPPSTPVVFASGAPGDPSFVEARWSASDPETGIIAYRYAIGSAPGAFDIVNWTSTTDRSFSRNGLGLIEGRMYWVSVQAQNAGGLWSPSGLSGFISGQTSHRTVYLPVVLRHQ